MAKSLSTPFNPPPPTTLFFVGATCCRLVTSEAKLRVATLIRWRKASRVLNLCFQDTGLGGSNLKQKFTNLTSNLSEKR